MSSWLTRVRVLRPDAAALLPWVLLLAGWLLARTHVPIPGATFIAGGDLGGSVAVDPAGTLYVSGLPHDPPRERGGWILRFDRWGRARRILGSAETGYPAAPGVVDFTVFPDWVRVDSQGKVFATDRTNTRHGVHRTAFEVRRDGVLKRIVDFPVDAGPSGIGEDGTLYCVDHFRRPRVWVVPPGGSPRVVAGTGVRGYSGDGGPATKAELSFPSQVAAAPDGSVYIADSGNNRIRKVDPQGIITTVAGNGQAGFSGDGGQATTATLNESQGIALGPDGSLYVGDSENSRIRRVDPSGVITTIAGCGQKGYAGDGRKATRAYLGVPFEITVDRAGNVYFVDGAYDNSVRKVDTRGRITTVLAYRSRFWR